MSEGVAGCGSGSEVGWLDTMSFFQLKDKH
jgi:hypothetical protein